MKKAIIMSLVLNLILASLLLFTPHFLALKQVHVDAKKVYEHKLPDPMSDVKVGVVLFVPVLPQGLWWFVLLIRHIASKHREKR